MLGVLAQSFAFPRFALLLGSLCLAALPFFLDGLLAANVFLANLATVEEGEDDDGADYDEFHVAPYRTTARFRRYHASEVRTMPHSPIAEQIEL